MRCAAGFIAATVLGACATLPPSAEPPSPAQSQAEGEAGPVYFVRAPTSDPNVFALKLAEADPAPGYELVAWHPLARERSDKVFVPPDAPPVSGADIVGTSVMYPCDLGLGSPGYGVWVFFRPASHARVREFSRGRRDGLIAALVEGKAIAVARMRGEISNRMQICPESASREEATRLARVLAGEENRFSSRAHQATRKSPRDPMTGESEAESAVLSRQATERDMQSMLDTLVPAFADDPVWGGWAFPDRSRATAQRRALFGLWLQGALRYRSIRVTQSCEAVAAWYAPEGTRNSEDDQLELVAMARALLGSHAEVFLRGCELLEAAHPQGRHHYYLSLVGIHGDHRGKGLGMGLLRENLETLDAAGMPSYLESTNPKNAARYERLGFRRIGALDLPGAGPRVDMMWREPCV